MKSIGTSKTFPKGLTEFAEVRDKVIALATELFERMNQSKIMARILTVSMTTVKFVVHNKCQ
jgi:nucleotidyltransferase/DNA polymerase involved in DNA repair